MVLIDVKINTVYGRSQLYVLSSSTLCECILFCAPKDHSDISRDNKTTQLLALSSLLLYTKGYE